MQMCNSRVHIAHQAISASKNRARRQRQLSRLIRAAQQTTQMRDGFRVLPEREDIIAHSRATTSIPPGAIGEEALVKGAQGNSGVSTCGMRSGVLKDVE